MSLTCYSGQTMSTVAFDTLAFSKRLQKAGVPVVQAEAHAIAQADFLTHHLLSEVATKDDLKALQADFKALQTATKADFKALQTDFKALQTATKADFKALQTDFKALQTATEANLKAGLAELETKLTAQIMKAAALQFVLLGGLMAMFKFIG